MSNFSPGDIVVVVNASADLTGAIGVVRGEGNVWDYTVVFPTRDNETFRLDPEQLVEINLETLIALASPVSDNELALLRWRG